MEIVASLSQGRTAAAQCGLFTYKSVPAIFEPPCSYANEVKMAFIIRIYHDARSCECQIHAELCCCSSLTVISHNVLLLNILRLPNCKQFISSYHAANFSDSTS